VSPLSRSLQSRPQKIHLRLPTGYTIAKEAAGTPLAQGGIRCFLRRTKPLENPGRELRCPDEIKAGKAWDGTMLFWFSGQMKTAGKPVKSIRENFLPPPQKHFIVETILN
jgi:hypothetical protein